MNDKFIYLLRLDNVKKCHLRRFLSGICSRRRRWSKYSKPYTYSNNILI